MRKRACVNACLISSSGLPVSGCLMHKFLEVWAAAESGRGTSSAWDGHGMHVWGVGSGRLSPLCRVQGQEVEGSQDPFMDLH